jgi:hypothetical protein
MMVFPLKMMVFPNWTLSVRDFSCSSELGGVLYFHCSTDWERKFLHTECMLNLAAWASCTSFLARPCCVTAAWRSLVSTNDRICLSFSLSSLFSGCSVELPSANQTWQWKIHHIYRWFSQEPLRLYMIYYIYVVFMDFPLPRLITGGYISSTSSVRWSNPYSTPLIIYQATRKQIEQLFPQC